jgi:hypothetical protein
MTEARHSHETAYADQSLMAEYLNGEYDRAELTAAQAVNLLIYPDAPLKKADHDAAVEHAMQGENIVYYAQELQNMSEEVGLDKVLELASTMRDAGVATTRALGIEPSPYARSVSWALWDMAKQRYTSKPEFLEEAGPDYPYRDQTGDPLASPRVRRTIINRQVGWEIDTHMQQPGENRYLFPIAHTPQETTINEIRRTGRRNGATQELNSLDLARTGEAAIAGLRTEIREIPGRYASARHARQVKGVGASMLGNKPRSDIEAFNNAELTSLAMSAEYVRTVPKLLKEVREWDSQVPVPPPAPVEVQQGDIRLIPTWNKERREYATPTSYVPHYASPIERFVTKPTV